MHEQPQGQQRQTAASTFQRNVSSVIPKGSGEMAAATIRTLFIQPTAATVHHQLGIAASMLGQQFPKVSQTLLVRHS